MGVNTANKGSRGRYMSSVRMRKTKKRPIACSSSEQRFTVLRINGDPHDTYAARSFEQALSHALPDRGARIEVFRTCAKDAGAARLPAVYKSRGVLVKIMRYKGR